MKILTVCDKSCYGVVSSFRHLESTGLTQFKGIDFPENLGEQFDGFLQKCEKEHIPTVIIGAWNPAYMELIKMLKIADINVAVGWFSPLSQTELDHDGENLRIVLELLEEGFIDYFLMACREDALFMHDHIDKRILHLPQVFNVEDTAATVRAVEPGFNVDVFFTPTSRKNVFVQLCAIKQLERDARFHMKEEVFKRSEYASFAKIINVYPILHKRKSRQDYYNFVASMDLGMQVTFSESFNYVLAEHFALGVPVLSTYMNPLMPKDRLVERYLMVKKADDQNEIANKLHTLKTDRKILSKLGRICKDHIQTLTKRQIADATSLIEEIMEPVFN